MNEKIEQTLTFYSVLNHSDIGKTFCNYLNKQNKEETWKFIVSSQLLEILVQKSNKKRASKQIKHILISFFDLQNKKKLETMEAQQLFSNILEKKKNLNLDLLYPLIIDLKNLLLPIYKNIEFKNFQSTPEARELCKTYSTNKLLVLHFSKDEGLNDLDFERNTLQKKDFEFFMKLQNEESKDWIETLSTENLKIFQSFQHHLQNVKFLELPVVVRAVALYDGNIQETSAGMLDKFFENDSSCVSFKVIHYQEDYFIVEQYVKRPPGETRVRRLICTLKYENGTIIGIMKPLKIPEMEFLKYKDLKYNKNGKEIVERGVQEFYYFTFCISKVTDDQCKAEFICIYDGRFGISGVPQSFVNQKTLEFYKQFSSGLKKTKGKTIKDFKDSFNEMKSGLPLNPFAKMLYDLNLDQYEASKVENQVFHNILGNIQIPNQIKEVKENFLENISIESSIPNDDKEKLLNKESFGNIGLLNVIKSEIIENQQPDSTENSELDLTFSDMVNEMSEDCLSEILDFEYQNEFLESFDFEELNLVFD
jgi:hypothetical protein